MNERVKELAEQCHHRYSEHHIDLEKFVESVVQECCDVIERRYKYSNGTPMSFWEMSQDVQDLLKKHFGVE